MAKTKKWLLKEEKPTRSRKPKAEKPAEQHTGSTAREAPNVSLQRRIGNQAIQRVFAQRRRADDPALAQAELVQRQTPEETVTKGSEGPGVAGSSAATTIADYLTVLDTGLTLAEIGGVAVAEGLAGSVGLGACIAFVVASMYGLAEAYKAGEKWAAVQGESYAIVYLAHGKQPPPAPGWMKAGASFNRAAQQAKQRLGNAVKKKGTSARHTLNVLLSIRRNPEAALNDIYQHLVKENLQATFLGFKLGGRLYQVAKSYKLTWPEVKAVSKE